MKALHPTGALAAGVLFFAAAGCENPAEPPLVIPAAIQIVAGNDQTGGWNGPLPQNIRVLATDSLLRPLGGVRIRFETVSGGGRAEPDAVYTDSAGVAETSWILGGTPGEQILQARVARPGQAPLIVSASAVALALTRVAVRGAPYGMAVSATGRIYATRLLDDSLATGSLGTRTMTPGLRVGNLPTGVAFNPAGTQAWVTNQGSNTVSVIDAATSTVVATITVPNTPFVVLFSAGGTEAFIGTALGRVYRVNSASRTITDSLDTGAAANGLALSPDGTRLYASATNAGTVAEVLLATFSVNRTFVTGGIPQGLAVAADGAELYVANEAGRVEVWNLTTGNHVTDIPLASGAFGLALRPDGSQLAASLFQNGRVVLINRTARTVAEVVMVDGDPRRLTYSANGATLIVANQSGWVDFIP